jgi:hypothetical protein
MRPALGTIAAWRIKSPIMWGVFWFLWQKSMTYRTVPTAYLMTGLPIRRRKSMKSYEARSRYCSSLTHKMPPLCESFLIFVASFMPP